MWGIFVSAFMAFLTSILRGSIIKFVFFTAIAYLISALGGIITTLLGSLVDFTGISTLFGQLPDGLLYFLTLFKFGLGLPLLLAAFVTRFAIRRIPFLG